MAYPSYSRATSLSRPRRPTTSGTVEWSPAQKKWTRETLERSLDVAGLTGWEQEFVESVLHRLYSPHGKLTFRQAEVVQKLMHKIGHGY